MTELPVGWGSRTNGTDPSLSIRAERPGNWTEMGIRSKYTLGKEASTSDSNLPFGFGNRDNSKSMEELSLSSNATNVAVAEAVLRGEGRKNDGELGYIKPVDPREVMRKETISPSANGTASVSVGMGDQQDPTVMMLAKVVVQMDGRLREMERTLAEVMQKQDEILKAVHERGR